MPLEELDFPFMLLRGLTGSEGSEIATLPGLRILLAGIQAILSRLKFSDHTRSKRLASIRGCIARRERFLRSYIDDVALRMGRAPASAAAEQIGDARPHN